MGRPVKAMQEYGSLEECGIAMTDLLIAQLDLAALEAERNFAVAAAQAQFEVRLDEARARAAEIEASLQRYCDMHRGEIEAGGKKSVQLPTGVMGWRKDPDSLALLNKKWTWKRVGEVLQAAFGCRWFLPPADPKLDRDKIKREFPPDKLREFGLQVKGDEKFYVEPAEGK